MTESDSFLHLLSRALQTAAVQGNVLIAVSGGADSIALLQGCCRLQESLGIRVHAAHFDHALRADSAEDLDWVRRQCLDHDIPFVGKRRAAVARATHVEEDARHDRYTFLQHAAHDFDCRWIALGHTANDQAETVLHHILRGTSISGLAGIPCVRALDEQCSLVRPLLGIEREVIEQWLRYESLTWREDPTNRDCALTRNRLRHELLPLLRQSINPQVDDALIRLSAQARRVQEALDWSAARLREHVVIDGEPDDVIARVDCRPLRDIPAAILGQFLIRLWDELGWPRQKVSSIHWTALTSLLQRTGAPSGHSLPGGIQADWRRSVLTLSRSRRHHDGTPTEHSTRATDPSDAD
ncbi:MAG: tRNA lysidine(34) synthetase TilS [Planctomycetaceae bacterium]|nr:tRNA lysidine(34) synthetase TilS [Planctomycetaceae bacterium]